MAEEKIRIITYKEVPPKELTSKELPKVFYTPLREKTEISISRVKEELNKFLDMLDDIMQESKQEIGNFEIDTLEIFAEIDANGQVGFLGTGIQVGAEGGIKIILKRKHP
jgi:hypothetical protein